MKRRRMSEAIAICEERKIGGRKVMVLVFLVKANNELNFAQLNPA
ncbi:unnamed protein product [Chironomus riparius]|uniref:Uncharacterized protein n=1 Tax=Chironomus riparius TaxID=315576 RepID=A0A9N9WS13_9DIPT|nr:unnamed protein product [Chironomus riparius]